MEGIGSGTKSIKRVKAGFVIMNIKKQTNKDDGCDNNMEKFLRTMIGIRIKQNQNDKRETGRSRSESKEEY